MCMHTCIGLDGKIGTDIIDHTLERTAVVSSGGNGLGLGIHIYIHVYIYIYVYVNMYLYIYTYII
jgi:hypothetical protein